LAEGVYDMTESKEWWSSFSLRDQLERATLSVSNNIAEGFERGTTNELLAFLSIARGSSGEVRSMLCFLDRRKGFAHFKSQIIHLCAKFMNCLCEKWWTDFYMENKSWKH
jgi:four helix bundle protein